MNMDNNRMVRSFRQWRPTAVRRISRPTLNGRMMSERIWDKMKIQNRSNMAKDRETWKRIVEQARTHKQS
jgi:hypothetical protein